MSQVSPYAHSVADKTAENLPLAKRNTHFTQSEITHRIHMFHTQHKTPPRYVYPESPLKCTEYIHFKGQFWVHIPHYKHTNSNYCNVRQGCIVTDSYYKFSGFPPSPFWGRYHMRIQVRCEPCVHVEHDPFCTCLQKSLSLPELIQLITQTQNIW